MSVVHQANDSMSLATNAVPHPAAQWTDRRHFERRTGRVGRVSENVFVMDPFVRPERASLAQPVSYNSVRLEPAVDYFVRRDHSFIDLYSMNAPNLRPDSTTHVGLPRGNGASLRVQRQPAVTYPEMVVPTVSGITARPALSMRLTRPQLVSFHGPPRVQDPVPFARVDLDLGRSGLHEGAPGSRSRYTYSFAGGSLPIQIATQDARSAGDEDDGAAGEMIAIEQ
jgi:hypothetical protein